MSGTASPVPRRPDARTATAAACRLVRTAAERERHYAIRRAVFVAEQALFAGDDRDALDDGPRTLHAIGLIEGRIGGTVRLYPLAEPGLWKGDRLAVLPALRHGLLGAELVRFAVRTAAVGLLRALRAGLGRPLDRASAALLAAASPTRVLLGALGRVEIDGPIGAASGPRTVLHPALLAQGLELPPGLALPEGYAPLLSVTAAGRTRPWPHVA